MQFNPLFRFMVLVGLLISLSTGVQARAWGWLEGVYLDGVEERLRAKLDTGALTSSIHGIVKDRFKRDGEDWVRFEFKWFQKSKKNWVGPYLIEAPLVRKVKIKDHEDVAQKRLVVYLNFGLDEDCYSGEFSLANRTGFNYPVLLGRRFLSGKAVIDPSRSFTQATVQQGENPCKSINIEANSDMPDVVVLEPDEAEHKAHSKSKP